MGNEQRHTPENITSPPPSLALKPSGLRVRPKAIRNGISTKTNNISSSRQVKDECLYALLPALLISGVWCFGCYIYLWVSLYQSLNADVDGSGVIIDKRRDILAIKLEQFLTGASDDTEASENYTRDRGSYQTINFNMTVLEQIVDPSIANYIQSTLTSKTGYPNLILGASLEPPLLMNKETMRLRTKTPQNLKYTSFPYHRVEAKNDAIDNQPKFAACYQGAQWAFPTFHPKYLDHYFEGNVFKKHPNFDKRWELALGKGNANSDSGNGYCPVDADPYLPWIHDSFPSNDGNYVEFIISNKRRCNTDPKTFQSDLKNLEPQIALMQPIPVKRLEENEEDEFGDTLKKLWSPHMNNEQTNNQSETWLAEDHSYHPPRYILGTSLDDADEDGRYSRFICRFHAITVEESSNGTYDQPRLRKKILGETLSNYPYNPEHANYRKRGSQPMLTVLEKGHDEQIWNSIYTVRCPVPKPLFTGDNTNNNTLSSIIASGKSVIRDVPSLYLDLVPIRTPVRRNREGFGLPGVTQSAPNEPMFDPKIAWGDAHVLPLVEASGRWTNIPICRPPRVEEQLTAGSVEAPKSVVEMETKNTSPAGAQSKRHFLVGCVWASASFATRGQASNTDSSTGARLREFLTYHTQVAGFDHIYVYDNSANSADNATSLAAVTRLFSSSVVTRIPWPHRICNNNRPMHANPGERSSQYAAANSCRARYGPDTTWMVSSLDVDEYLIPTGKQWNNLRHWLQHVTSHEKSTKILSFFQTRALPNLDLMIPYNGVGGDILNSMRLIKDPQKTFMEAYNCEPTTHPKPESWAWRAKKQIYRPDFVLNHFVHYSVVTRQILDKPLETSPRFAERAPFERRVNELTEGFLLHAKTTGPDMTHKWQEQCPRKGTSSTKKSSCKVGIVSPTILLGEETNSTMSKGDGTEPSNFFESNCYRHSRVSSEWVPKVEKALRSLG